MADSVTQPDTNEIEASQTDEQKINDDPVEEDEAASISDEQTRATAEPSEAATAITAASDERRAPIVWTPGFITIFALALAIGMSINTVLAQNWIDGGGNEYWIMVIHVLLIFGGWIAAIVIARSRWVRLGSIFGCIWAAFTILNLTTGYLHSFHTFEIQASLNALISCSLLGLSICFSIDRTPLRRWDTWFFRLAIIAGIGIAAIPYALMFGANPDPGVLESDIAAAAVILSLPTWWLRPSCWRSQPALTLLFGLAPAILLYLAIPGAADRTTNIFFLETLYLCMFLGITRVIQGELRWKKFPQTNA